jgi:hypothetical protein
MPSIIDLLNTQELDKCFPYRKSYLHEQIETLTVKQFIEISYAILPIIYPNGIVEKENIFGVGWHFLNARAKEKKQH